MVQHAAAAVDHHGIRGKVLWEFGAGAELEIQGLAGVLLEPVWQLYGADVVALAVVGTALSDENSVPVLKVFQGWKRLPLQFSGSLCNLPSVWKKKSGGWNRV